MAVEKKRSFLLYCDLKPQIDMLSYEEKGRLFEAIYSFVNGDEMKKLPFKAELVFKGIEGHLARDKKKYDDICRKRAEAGRIGGLKSGEVRRAMKQKEANEADNDSDSENDNDSDSVSVSDNDNVNDNDNINVLSEEEAFIQQFYTPEQIAEYEKKKREGASLFKKAFGREPAEKEMELLLSLMNRTDEEILDHAFEQAAINDRKNLGYVQGVIKNLREKGITNMKEMFEYDRKTGNF